MRLHVKYPLSLSDIYKIIIFSTDLEKYLNINFHENPSRVVELFHAEGRIGGQTGKHDKANSCFSQVFEHPWNPFAY